MTERGGRVAAKNGLGLSGQEAKDFQDYASDYAALFRVQKDPVTHVTHTIESHTPSLSPFRQVNLDPYGQPTSLIIHPAASLAATIREGLGVEIQFAWIAVRPFSLLSSLSYEPAPPTSLAWKCSKADTRRREFDMAITTCTRNNHVYGVNTLITPSTE